MWNLINAPETEIFGIAIALWLAWGAFKADSVPVEVAGKRQAEATKLMDRAGWN